MNELENLLRKAEPHLRAKQICTYWKIPNDLRLTGDAVVFGQRGPCDFIGHTTRGEALLIEAKICQKRSLAVPSKGGIPGHQWVALRDANAAGAIALIAWMRGSEIALLPFQKAEELLGDRRSIPWSGGLALQSDEPSVVIVRALIELIDLHRQLRNAAVQVIERYS